MPDNRRPLILALSKGRVLNDSLPLLNKLGIKLAEDFDNTRKLISASNESDLSAVLVRAPDVINFVNRGIVDFGIAGKDLLLEHNSSTNLYQCLDLKIARCKLMTAALSGYQRSKQMLRIATKYTNIATQFYTAMGIQIQCIKLYGSMELAPALGLVDEIVDVVGSGQTLKINNLQPLEKICDVSSYLIVNKNSFYVENKRVQQLLKRFEQQLNQ